MGPDQLKESNTKPIKKNTGVSPGHPKKTPILYRTIFFTGFVKKYLGFHGVWLASITQHKYVALKKIVLSPAGMVLATLGLALCKQPRSQGFLENGRVGRASGKEVV